uniref:Uncharacterized protein n=1 Tax=Aegilops tauschii subsp. strangulata TaxID=200361 RepID=A0A453L3B7_AEGTS
MYVPRSIVYSLSYSHIDVLSDGFIFLSAHCLRDLTNGRAIMIMMMIELELGRFVYLLTCAWG